MAAPPPELDQFTQAHLSRNLPSGGSGRSLSSQGMTLCTHTSVSRLPAPQSHRSAPSQHSWVHTPHRPSSEFTRMFIISGRHKLLGRFRQAHLRLVSKFAETMKTSPPEYLLITKGAVTAPYEHECECWVIRPKSDHTNTERVQTKTPCVPHICPRVGGRASRRPARGLPGDGRGPVNEQALWCCPRTLRAEPALHTLPPRGRLSSVTNKPDPPETSI